MWQNRDLGLDSGLNSPEFQNAFLVTEENDTYQYKNYYLLTEFAFRTVRY